MELELTREFLRSCHVAKRIVEHMPALPKGLKSRHLYIMETIDVLNREQDMVRVSDISERMGVTKPSITKLINELVDLGLVEKKQHDMDKRVFTLTLTKKGKKTFALYGTEFHSLVNDELAGISETDMTTAIRVIHEVAAAVDTARREFERRES